MKITINKETLDFTPNLIEESKHTFSFLDGRKFSFKFKDQTWIKDISLNNLIEAVKTATGKQEQDCNEVKDFLKLFKKMRHEGYENPHPSIKTENFLIQILAKIKHFFAERKRDKLLKELSQTTVELKKAQLIQQAFLKWKEDLKSRIESSDRGVRISPKTCEKFKKEFLSQFSNEVILDLEKHFSFTRDRIVIREDSFRFISGFEFLIDVAKAGSVSHHEEVVRLLKDAIDCRLDGLKVLPEDLKFLEVIECLKALAIIDSASASQYKELVKFNIGLFNDGNDSWKKLKWVEILSMIDLPGFVPYINTLDSAGQGRIQTLICSMVEAGHKNLEQILTAINRIENEETKAIGFLCLVGICPKSEQNIHKILPFMQKAIANSTEEILLIYALAFAELGELKIAFEIIEKISNRESQEVALIRIAKIYAKKDVSKISYILEKINIENLEVSNPFDCYRLAKVYSLVDVEKALKVCERITDIEKRIHALLNISNILKKTNLEKANSIWQTILDFATKTNETVSYLSLLEIVRQKAEIDRNEAKQFLENKLLSFPDQFSMKGLLENILSSQPVFHRSKFIKLIKSYAALDLEQTEEWLREYTPYIEPIYQTEALLTLRDKLVN